LQLVAVVAFCGLLNISTVKFGLDGLTERR
jgi:hypothetical protein